MRIGRLIMRGRVFASRIFSTFGLGSTEEVITTIEPKSILLFNLNITRSKDITLIR